MLLRRTSFEAVLEGFDSDAPEKWPLKGKSLPYGKLQCAMEDCAETAAHNKKDPASKGCQPFFNSLIEEIERVDGCAPGFAHFLCFFWRHAEALLAATWMPKKESAESPPAPHLSAFIATS